MEPWYSGAVVDAVREAKTRQALFIVYVRDDSAQSQSMDQLWSDVWTTITDTSKIVALRLDKDSAGCNQFSAIYKVQAYPTVYLINGQNGQVLKSVDQPVADSSALEQIVQDGLEIIDPKQPAAAQPARSVDERVSDRKLRFVCLHM